MKILKFQPSLTDQVYDAIVDQICEGALPAGSHLVQEQLAERLGVSRQPVQQAMALLKADGMVEEVGRRGLWVTPLDADLMRHHYDIRPAFSAISRQSSRFPMIEVISTGISPSWVRQMISLRQ